MPLNALRLVSSVLRSLAQPPSLNTAKISPMPAWLGPKLGQSLPGLGGEHVDWRVAEQVARDTAYEGIPQAGSSVRANGQKVWL
jgi:hypothetical protein